jgi:hypothetical protein
VVIDLPGAGQAAVVAAVRGIDRSDPDYYNLLVANAILGTGSNGRLFEEVRTKRALSYGANSSHPARADDALLTASAQTKNESAADVAKIFLDELDRLGKQPLTPDEGGEAQGLRVRPLHAAVRDQRRLRRHPGRAHPAGPLAVRAVRYSRRSRVSPAAATKARARISSSDRATW